MHSGSPWPEGLREELAVSVFGALAVRRSSEMIRFQSLSFWGWASHHLKMWEMPGECGSFEIVMPFGRRTDGRTGRQTGRQSVMSLAIYHAGSVRPPARKKESHDKKFPPREARQGKGECVRGETGCVGTGRGMLRGSRRRRRRL